MHDLNTIRAVNAAEVAKATAHTAELLAPYTNDDGIMFEPFREGNALGWKVTEIQTGLVEYILLSPSSYHEVNYENGATADTHIYHVDHGHAAEWEAEHHDTTQLVDFGYPVAYVNHFVGSAHDPDPSDPDIEPEDPWSALDEHDPNL